MDIKEKISFAINQISVNNCDGSSNENGIKAVRYLQEVHEALSQHDVINQRELLLDFAEYSENDKTSTALDELVDNYLDSIKQ